MSSPARKLFLYFLTDSLGRCYYLQNGIVNTTNIPTPLPQTPGGWIDKGCAFGRSSHYFGINRSFTGTVRFVKDGATIIRNLFYKRRGVEEVFYLNVNKWNDQTGIFETYDVGEVDLSQINDISAEAVEVNIIQSGVPKLIKSFENTVFEIPCDGSIPENNKVLFDGILFNDTFTYQILESAFQGSCFTVPVVYLNNQGDNVNMAKGGQFAESIPSGDYTAYAASSGNYLIKSFRATTVQITGALRFKNLDQTTTVQVDFLRSDGTLFNIYNQTLPAGSTANIVINSSIAMNNQALFLIFRESGAHANESMSFSQCDLSINFNSKFDNSYNWAINARDLFSLLWAKISGGKSLTVSTLLDGLPNIMITSGDSLRQTPKAVIKTTLAEFFDSMNAVLNCSMGNMIKDGKEVIFLESKGKVFDSSVVTMDMGQVSDLRVSVATEHFFNTIKVGYAPQSYEEKAGKQEYNTTAFYATPAIRQTKELNLVSKYRADSYGIEYTRLAIAGTSVVNNASDNAVFMINASSSLPDETQAVGISGQAMTSGNNTVIYSSVTGADFSVDPSNSILTYTNLAALLFDFACTAYVRYTTTSGNTLTFKVLKNGVVIGTQTITLPTATAAIARLDLLFTGITVMPGDVITLVINASFSGAVINSSGMTMTSADVKIFVLNRVTYDTISGVINPTSAYNIELLSPARMIKRHSNYLHSFLHNLPGDTVKFQTSDKNKDLSTTVGGVTITENANVEVSGMDAALFYPYVFQFKSKVPVNFVDLLSNAANGHIKFEYNGKTFYGFPIEVSSKPALDESQEMKLLCSPLTNLADLVDLDIDGLNYLNLMGYSTFIPHLCPIKFVPKNTTDPVQYHFKHMDQTFFKNQVQFYASEKANYFQKFQNSDVVKLQFQTDSLGPVQVYLYKADFINGAVVGTLVSTTAMPSVSAPAIITPMALFEVSIALTGLAEAAYYFVITAGTGGSITEFISEGLWIKSDWPGTLLFEYTNDRNKQSTIFSTGYNPSIRVEGVLLDFKAESKFATYEDQPADMEMLNGIPYRVHKLFLGANDGLPPWMIDKINRIMLLKTVLIDGVAFTRNGDAKFEDEQQPGWPMKYHTLEIREANNRDGITLSTDGTALDNNITVVYNIDTKAFGDGSGSSNVVQVTEVD